MPTTKTLPIGDILNLLMRAENIYPTELARRTNVAQPTIQRLVNGTVKNPQQETLAELAKFFSITVDQLVGKEPIPALEAKKFASKAYQDNVRSIPLLGWNEYKDTMNLDDQQVKQIWLDIHDIHVGPKAFALSMKDASMEPQFRKDTILIFDPDITPKDRNFVVVKLKQHEDMIFRQLLIDEPDYFLKSLSPDFEQFPMKTLTTEDKIVGVLVQARQNYTT